MAFFIKSITEDMPGRVSKAKEVVASNLVRKRTAVFEDILRSPALPESDKSVCRLTGDGTILVAAGTETSAVGHIPCPRPNQLAHLLVYSGLSP